MTIKFEQADFENADFLNTRDCPLCRALNRAGAVDVEAGGSTVKFDGIDHEIPEPLHYLLLDWSVDEADTGPLIGHTFEIAG